MTRDIADRRSQPAGHGGRRAHSLQIARSSSNARSTGRIRRGTRRTTASASPSPPRAGDSPKAASAERPAIRPTSCSRIPAAPRATCRSGSCARTAPSSPRTSPSDATSRVNVAVTGPGSDVPELANESFGAVIDATQPIAVERSFYSNVGGTIWAAGTNATATRLSPPEPLTVSVEATDDAAAEVGSNTGTFTFTRSGGTPAAALTIFYTISGTATNGNDYSATGIGRVIPANQTSATVTITPFAGQPLRRSGDGDA